MKKLILLGLAIVLFTACQQQEKRYTQQSPEIESVKTHIENYNSKRYDFSIYADTAKTYFNSKTPILKKDLEAYHKANDKNYSTRGFTGEDPEYEMVVTDEGKTWVNCWLLWKGTMAGNGKVIEIPIHLTYQFIDGKIVRELGYWDPTEVVLNLQAIEAAEKSKTEENTEE
ncbi:nuclear transport factor 2 family protein [Psychroserpens sp. XS_ASV72]|uniref:nuclear transport factor 2 family protein n=1 Tax=Psychroserpens sp. XS_ASV72 TaxID=3241293 RepID=UPI003517C2DB